MAFLNKDGISWSLKLDTIPRGGVVVVAFVDGEQLDGRGWIHGEPPSGGPRATQVAPDASRDMVASLGLAAHSTPSRSELQAPLLVGSTRCR